MNLNQIFSASNNCNYCKLFQQILDLNTEPYVIVDDQARVVFFNKAYEKFLNIPREEAINQHVTNVIENTRLHIVCKNKVAEIDRLQSIHGRYAIVQRIPILNDGTLIGAIGKVNFLNSDELVYMVKKVKSLENKLEEYKNSSSSNLIATYNFNDIIGNSTKINSIKILARKIASSDLTVLLLGDTGVGKELFAHAIHNYSPRNDGPFVGINCASIPRDLLESELFGYEEGAFTGAKKLGKLGKFELADGGTLFLDEIGDMPLRMQSKILRVIQDKNIERIGGTKICKIDVRIIASTNQNIKHKINIGEFREDLFYRLNCITIEIPPLRHRLEDIPEIVQSTLKKNKTQKTFSLKAIEVLSSYTWPGNVRELINVIESLIFLAEENIIGPELVKEKLYGYSTNNSIFKSIVKQNNGLNNSVDMTEKEMIYKALGNTKGNKTQAAKLLGIHRTTLYNKIHKYKITLGYQHPNNYQTS